VITHAVTKGIDADAPMKPSGIEWIGDIPATWEMTKLGYLGRSANGINVGGDAFGSGYPFISYGDVYKNRQLPKVIKGLVQSTKSDRLSYSLKQGDILFTRTSETVDEVAFPSVCMETVKDAVFAGFLIRFRPFPDRLVTLFSKYAFQSGGLRDFFAKEMKLVTRASLSQGLLQSMPLPLPPLQEQAEIAEFLEKQNDRFAYLTTKTTHSIALLKEKRAALITAAVTGKIDVRGMA
jgi:type I restriction enzyme S subunit